MTTTTGLGRYDIRSSRRGPSLVEGEDTDQDCTALIRSACVVDTTRYFTLGYGGSHVE